MKGRIASELKALRDPKLRILAMKTLLLRPLYVVPCFLLLPAITLEIVSLAAQWLTNRLAYPAHVIWWLDDKIEDYYLQAMKEKQDD